MCGIAGIIDKNSGNALPALLEVMLDFIYHRGPDGKGTYFDGPIAMGMRRLSIIDLEGGAQPFYSRGGGLSRFKMVKFIIF